MDRLETGTMEGRFYMDSGDEAESAGGRPQSQRYCPERDNKSVCRQAINEDIQSSLLDGLEPLDEGAVAVGRRQMLRRPCRGPQNCEGLDEALDHGLEEAGSAGPRVRGPKKRQVVLWTCCVCGQSGMSMRVDPCLFCGTPRCMYCPVSKVKSKPHAAHSDHGHLYDESHERHRTDAIMPR
ncbi:hypothetical protein B0T10DRAFT_487432 [Thelonectria olida]|uniref:Uncharacterized protein n=1 Tax=Thelonectria olida TaxID=1576542 RepID=A0A9P9ALM2_9HYPO|nr:hypothetical protein B0T10DRAFT_487432 [Thelonectria olida]